MLVRNRAFYTYIFILQGYSAASLATKAHHLETFLNQRFAKDESEQKVLLKQ